MKPTFDHYADHDLKINYNVIKGDFKFEDFVKKLDKVVRNPDYNVSYNILIDIREANFINFMKKSSILIDYFQDKLSFLNMNRKCAFLTSKPIDIAHATLIIEKFRIVGFPIKFEIFSSEGIALSWLSV